MDEYAVAVFAVSLAVTVLSALYSRYQSARLAKALTPKPTGDASEYPTALAPEITAVRVSHSIDLSTNFPAAILTIIAFMNPAIVRPGAVWIYFFLLAVAVTMACCIFSPVRYAGRYMQLSIRGVSLFSILLVAANIVGLLVAVLH